MQIGIWTDHESVIEYGIQLLYEQIGSGHDNEYFTVLMR